MNHLQQKLLEQCVRHGMSVDQIFDTLKAQRDLCQKMMKHQEECFARKTYKKSVMVTCNYGGTAMTSRQDVLYQLKSMESKFLYDCTPSEVTMFCNMVFWSMEAGVPSAMRFLNYFRKLLSFVMRYKDAVVFKNPLTGFPVALRVYEEEVHGFSYVVHGKNLKARITRKLKTTNKRKTVSSSVPGVIHSIDGAILAMLKMNLEDVPMTYVHDSIGVHPNNMEQAKQAVYNSLNATMNHNVFQNIVDQLLADIPDEDIPDELRKAPYEGTWVVEEINQDNAYYSYS